MGFAERLIDARTRRRMTQADLAEKLCVTRQAISRWENDQTSPSVDMVKLIAVILDVPVTELLELPEGICQSCGMPITSPELHGTEADGSSSEDYCKWCYADGSFAVNCTKEEMMENCARLMEEQGTFTLDEAVSYLGTLYPRLKRWMEADAHTRV